MTTVNRDDQWTRKGIETDEVGMLQVDLASRASDATENTTAAPGAMEPTDPMERTLQRARNGDQAAFAELVRKHQAMVFSLARAFLRDRETAEELAQDVFLSLYQNLGAIESAAHLKFWLRKVAGHRCIDYARKRKMPLVSVEDAPEPFSIFDMPDSLLRATLRRVVATLPEKPRLVVTLRYQEDLDPNEISELLDMPVNTVKSHLRRSLAILREKVGRIIDS